LRIKVVTLTNRICWRAVLCRTSWTFSKVTTRDVVLKKKCGDAHKNLPFSSKTSVGTRPKFRPFQ